MKTLFRVTIAVILTLTTCATAQTVAQGVPTSNAPPTASASGNQSAITWTLVTQSGIPDYVESIAYGNGRFVVVGRTSSGSKMAYSTDGITWTNAGTVGTINWANNIAYGAGRFVVVGSPDNWTDDGRRTSNEGMIAYSNVQE